MTNRCLLRRHLRPSSDNFSADNSDKEDLNKQLDPTVRKLTSPVPVFNPKKKLMSAKDRLTAKLKTAPSVFHQGDTVT